MRNKIFVTALVAGSIALFFGLGLHRYLTLESLKANRDRLVDFRQGHEAAAALLFMAVYFIQTALSLPGAAVLSLAAGAVFGPFLGTAYAVTGAATGAAAAFLVTRYLLRDTVQRKFGSKLERLNRELEREGLSYLLFLRLVPLFPFFLINIAAGLTRISLPTFFFATLIGIIPGGFVYVNTGASLATIERLADVASPRVLVSLALLGLFALVPVVYRRIKSRGTHAV